MWRNKYKTESVFRTTAHCIVLLLFFMNGSLVFANQNLQESRMVVQEGREAIDSEQEKVKNVTSAIYLETALEKLEEAHDVHFFFDPEHVRDKTTPVNDAIKLHHLDILLEQFELSYKEIKTGSYVIFPKPETDMKNADLFNSIRPYNVTQNDQLVSRKANFVTRGITNTYFSFGTVQDEISGTVTDAETGDVLMGVTVLVVGTDIGTSTDINGNYSIQASEDATLAFSSVGYQRQVVDVDGREEVNVAMEYAVLEMEEFVLVGYGAQREVNITGSVDRVSPDALVNRTQTNVGELLKGASPNLDIQMRGWGGEPGSTPSWKIRGMGSITGDTSPLILVDGVEMDIDQINPNDIENISILKDASASAVYGARGAFGVVLIETKQGSEGVELRYNNNLSWGTPLRLPSQEDSEVWARAFNEAAANAGISAPYPEEQMQRIIAYKEGTFEHEYNPDDPISFVWGGRRYGNANYNWPHEILGGTSLSQQHNLSLSGGVDHTTYHISLGNLDQPGLYNFGYDYYKRNNLLANVSSQVNHWLNFNVSAKYSQSKRDYPMGITSNERRWMLRNMMNFAPMTPMYNIDGTYQHPHVVNLLNNGRDIYVDNDLMLTLGTQIEPVEGWLTNITYNYNIGSERRTSNPKPVLVNLTTYGAVANVGRSSSSYEEVTSQPEYEMFNVRTSYENTLGSHYFKSMVGYEQEEMFSSTLDVTGRDLITTEVPSISTSLGTADVGDSKYHWATQGIFGRVNYNFNDRYLLEISGRYDGSSRFSEGNRWGLFPSASAGYVISEENFFNVPHINMLKFRGSYGQLGNQNVPNYLYLSSVPVSLMNNYVIGGQLPLYASAPGLTSAHLTWETITTLNLGLDAYFLDHRLNLKLDVYERATSDMFGPTASLPGVLGTGAPLQNNAAMETRGYEIVLGWQDRISHDLSYNVQFNFGDNKATITEYEGNPDRFINDWYPGKVVGEIWGFETDGIIQSENEDMPDQSEIYESWGPGDIKYKDLTGDGKVSKGAETLDDHGDLTVIGNNRPRYNFGLSAGATYRQFDIHIRLQGIGRRDWHPDSADMLYYGLGRHDRSAVILKDAYHLDYWRPADDDGFFGPNTDAHLPKPYFSNEGYKNEQTQTRFLENARYVRLKNVRVGYSVPPEISSRLGIQQARLYISGENLLTFQSLPKVYDPETLIASDPAFGGYRRDQPGMVYPLQRTFSFGVDLRF